MKTIQFKCPFCGQTYEGSATDVGAEAECESCGNSFRIKADAVSVVEKRPTGFGCYLEIFKRYFGFAGRSGRRAFWWAFLFNFLFLVVAGIVDGLAFDEYDDEQGLVIGCASLLTVIPMLAAQFRRLHDTGKSGWWFLLAPLPPLNLALLVWLVQSGDLEANRFGEPPKNQ